MQYLPPQSLFNTSSFVFPLNDLSISQSDSDTSHLAGKKK